MVSLAEREAGVDLITVSSEMETLGLQYGLGQGVGGLHAGQQR
jgi:hypothetical protein